MKEKCLAQEIKLKSNFLGPKSEAGDWLEQSVCHIFSEWCKWRRKRFPEDGPSISADDIELKEFKEFRSSIDESLVGLTSRFEDEVPTYSPRYMGHMVSDISLPALFGHLIALIHNPNNSSFCSAKVGLNIEKEAIEDIAKMLGYTDSAQGHFTSGGTVANIEGLWRARFRLDHNLSLGCYLNLKKKSNYSLFESAHMSYDEFSKKVKQLEENINVLKQYSFVLDGPYTIQSKYQEAFSQTFMGPVILVPGHKHFSWQKAVSLMGLSEESLWTVELNKLGHLSVDDLKLKIEKARSQKRPILAVVTVSGTTELGMIDPIDKVQDLLDEYKEKEGIHIWHHVDGAYGGVYTSMLRGNSELKTDFSETVKASLGAIARVESVTLDPHKLALVPYSCGAIIVKNTECYEISQFKAPYLLESTENSGKWNSTLEGSRSATGASATWMISKSMGLDRNGLGSLLSVGLGNKKELELILKQAHKNIRVIPKPDTNIICFAVSGDNEKSSISNIRVERIYKEICEGEDFAVSKTTLTKECYGSFLTEWVKDWNGNLDTNSLTLIRMVMMNPFTTSKENNFKYLEEFSKYLVKMINKIG